MTLYSSPLYLLALAAFSLTRPEVANNTARPDRMSLRLGSHKHTEVTSTHRGPAYLAWKARTKGGQHTEVTSTHRGPSYLAWKARTRGGQHKTPVNPNHCPAPDAAYQATIVLTNDANSTSAAAPGPNFLVIWSTNTASFGLVPRRCLESIFYHHPRATVTLFSNDLSPPTAAETLPVLRDLLSLGYDIRLRPYNLSEVLFGTPVAPWLARLEEWRRGRFFYSHVTDALRIALLFRYGGVYLDADVILVRPLRIAGMESTMHRPPPRGAAYADLRDALGVQTYNGRPATSFPDGDAPPGEHPQLNGAVLVFPARHSRFLWAAMAEFARSYNPNMWACVGPELLTRVALQLCAGPGGAPVQAHRLEAFYPFPWSVVRQLAANPAGEHGQEQRRGWARISQRAYTAHLWNSDSAWVTIEEGSLLHRLVHT